MNIYIIQDWNNNFNNAKKNHNEILWTISEHDNFIVIQVSSRVKRNKDMVI
jgi:hypothetical protein